MAKTSTTVGGKPAAPELNTEFASRLRDPFTTLFMGVLETNDPLLLERGRTDAAIYRDLKRDGKVFDGLQKRQLALIGKPWQVEPLLQGGDTTRDVETMTAILKACSFDAVCADLLDALLAGWVVAEIVWTVQGKLVVPQRIVRRDRRRFKFVQPDDGPPKLHMLTRENMLTGVAVPERKFIVHRVNPEDDNPYGTGLGLQLFWPVFFKRKGIVAWNKLCDRFGSPTPHGKYPRGAGPKEKSTLADALRAMSNDGYLITPEGMEVALLESKLSGNVTTQQALVEYMDDWIAAVLMGQEARSSGGGALAAASKERQDVREDLTQADSDLLSDTLNATLLAWICELNGLQPCRVYRQIKQDEDIKAMAETDKIVSDMGFELRLDTVRARYGEGWEKKATPAPAALPAATGRPGAAAVKAVEDGAVEDGEDGEDGDRPANFAERDAGRDAIDELVDAQLQDWEAVTAPMVAPLQAAIDEAVRNGESAQQLLARLPALLEQMDAGALAQALTQAAFTARLAAEAGVEPA